MISNRLKILCEIQGFSLYVYKPTLLKLFWENMEPCTLRKRIRFSLECMAGYKVYYLVKGSEKVGYCLVSSGGTQRYKDFSTKRDVIVGPYFIAPNWRGRHLSELMLTQVLKTIRTTFDYAYDYIEKTNIISQHTSKRVGFCSVCDIKVTAMFRILHKTNDGEYLLFRFNNAQEGT